MGSFIGASKKAMGSVGGGLIILCAFLLMWSSVSTEFETNEAISKAAARAEEIDVSRPDATNNGKLVVASGALSSLERLEDEYLKPGPYLVLERHVEMFQWNEQFENEGAAPTYSLEWVAGQRDFFSFKVPQGHENPLLPAKPDRRSVGQVSFGRFDGSQIISHIKVLEPLVLEPSMLKEPKLEIVDNKILIRRQAGVDSGSALGDVRISYNVLPRGDYTVLAQQEDERTLLGASPKSTLVIRRGLLSIDDFLRGVKRDTDKSAMNALFMGGGLLFFGLLSLLSPHRAKFDLRPHLNVQGGVAVLVVCGGLSLLVMIAFSIVGLTR